MSAGDLWSVIWERSICTDAAYPQPGTGGICFSRGREPADTDCTSEIEPRSGGTARLFCVRTESFVLGNRVAAAAAHPTLAYPYRGLTPAAKTNAARSGLCQRRLQRLLVLWGFIAH